MAKSLPFDAKATLETNAGTFAVAHLGGLTKAGVGHVDKLPYSIRVLLESCLRNCDGFVVTEDHIKALANYDAANVGEQEIPFNPGRVVLQDFTGVPAVVDFAALRSAMQRMGGDVSKVNPLIRADLVIDHSVQVDAYGSPAFAADCAAARSAGQLDGVQGILGDQCGLPQAPSLEAQTWCRFGILTKVLK